MIQGKDRPMEMRVVRHLDETAWKAFVADHPRGNIFHTPEMFRVFARAKGHRPELWATAGENGEVLALFLPVQTTTYGSFARYFTTRAVAYGGALCEPGPGGQKGLAVLLQTYTLNAEKNVIFTELRNLYDPSDHQHILSETGFSSEAHLDFLIDLNRPTNEIWRSIRSSARRNIEKARKSGVTVEEISDPSVVPSAYKLLSDVYTHIRVPLPHISLFRAAFEILHPRQMLRVLVARVRDTQIGVLFVLLYKDVALYWYTGTPRKYAHYRPADLLAWEALKRSQEYGCRVFDFGGGGKPEEKYGVRDFKAKFGGVLVNYGRNTFVHAPLRYRFSRAGYLLLRKLPWNGRQHTLAEAAGNHSA